jgi:hypothetical protein
VCQFQGLADLGFISAHNVFISKTCWL